jgi:hypothetical protein
MNCSENTSLDWSSVHPRGRIFMVSGCRECGMTTDTIFLLVSFKLFPFSSLVE